MKTMIKTLIVLVALAFSVKGIAGDLRPKVAVEGEGKTLVFTAGRQPYGAKVVLKDAEGNMFFTETVSKREDFKKVFDLGQFPAGAYYISLEDPIRTTVYKVNITDKSLTIGTHKEEVKPYFRKENGTIYLNYLNLDNKNVDLMVYDVNDHLVYSEEIRDTQMVTKSLNFKKAFSNKYTVVVTTGGKSYSEEIVVY